MPTLEVRDLATAAHVAWKAGQGELARELIAQAVLAGDERAARPALTRLRGLVELYSGDQGAAWENLRLAAGALGGTEPRQAAGLLFMAADAAHHRDRPDDAAACLRQVRELDCGPEYHRFAGWMAASMADELDDPAAEPWHILDSGPPELTEQSAHRWVLPLAISRFGPYPRTAAAFGVTACERLHANGMLAMHAVALGWLAELELRLGRWRDARAHAGESLRFATDTGQHATATDARAVLAQLAARTGDQAGCREHADQALRVAAVSHNKLAAARANWALGVSHLARGEYAAAVERLARPGHRQVAGHAVADLVEALVRGGDPGTAREVTEDFRRTITPAKPRLATALLHRCQALLPDEPAERHFRLSLSTSDADLRPFEQARTALLYGQWLRRERRVNDAKAQLLDALEVFDGLGATDWAAAALVELRATGARSSSSAAANLTAQEHRVAALAAAGLSNREIGARLFLSPRTVGYHLYKIFPKLGIATRAQLRDLALDK
ncbi:LuxR family transcriptional regulator [Amycolatopsis nigrescens]|uniref:LuxR family transcriptional regulator n=1 Tax=Amycolatopsis nigrescens TaxID=381445 RepID=UPI0003762DE0|nr:LuxR family transcriptional regulator [Amycolatopsis nigrescens]